jgi:hypothetical protein
MPPGEPIAAAVRAAFDAERSRLMQQLSSTLLARATPSTPDAVKAAQ